MFVKRDDGLGRVFIPFHIGALIAAVLLTLNAKARGLVLVPIFLGWYIAAFLGLILVFYLGILLYSLTIDMTAEPPKENHPHVRWVVDTVIGHLNRFARVRIHLTGQEKLPEGRFLLVSNHRSMYDPISTVWMLRDRYIGFITKPENLRIPLAGPMIYRAGYLPIDRENPREAMKTIRAATELLKNDVESIGVYPEGTRSREEDMLPFHNGVFKIAQKSLVPIVVLSTNGTELIKKRFPWKHTDVYLDILAVIYPEEHASAPTAEISARVRELLEQSLSPAPANP